MEKDPGKENDTSRGFVRIKLPPFESSEEENNFLEEEDKNKEHTNNIPSSWKIPTREERDLILAEEIIRFASIIDRPPTTSSITTVIQDVTDSNTMVGKGHKKLTPVTNDATSATVITSEAGSGPEPPQSYSVGLADRSSDALIGGPNSSIDPKASPPSRQLPLFKSDRMPMTNHILAAIAQQKQSEHYSSNDHTIPQATIFTKKDTPPIDDSKLYSYFLESLKYILDSDLSPSPDSSVPTSSRPSHSQYLKDGLSLLKDLFRATELEEQIFINMKKELEEIGNNDCGQANNQKESDKEGDNDGININPGDEIVTPPANAFPRQNDCQVNQDNNNLNDSNAGTSSARDDNEATQSEFPEEDKLSGVEWTRLEKQRLGIVIRDLSREIKRKELRKRKARLIKKGRSIAQAIGNKICDINKEIMAVNKKSLRHVALPLDQFQEYDWDKVASGLNAKRSPEECRTYWKCFLHPTINSSEWGLAEIQAMEFIAQRHNFRNWDEIAEELNTGRSGYQCYRFYCKNVCPHLDLSVKYK